MNKIGTFQIESGKVYVTDPCYSVGTWCQGVLDNVRNGTWTLYVKEHDVTVAKIMALHEWVGTEYSADRNLKWDILKTEIGVDSGQAGIFDIAHYRNENNFYVKCCDLSISEPGCGCLPFGCVSQSGYGDGSYECGFGVDKDGMVMAISITFEYEDDLEGEDDE